MYASLMLGVLAVIGFVVGAYRSGFYPALVQASGILIAGGALVWVSRIPVHYWTGLVHLTKRKLYGRGPEFVTQMANVDCAFFGKTGVVSRNDLKLERLFVMPAFQDREDWILSLIHQTKRMVNHPLINSLSGVGALIDGEPVMEDLQYNIVPGFGVEVNLTDGLGNRRKLRIGEQLYILGQNGESKFRAILEEHDLTSGKRIWFSLDGRLCAIAKLKEAWNISPQPFFAQMEYLGVPSGILTGDSEFDDARLEGLDLEKNLSSRQKQDRVVTEMESDQRVLFVGDGLNDFRAMSTSYVSVALRHSPDPLLASASAVLASNRLSTIAFSIPYCRRIIRLSKINEWAFLGGTALVSLGLILGWLNPLAALTAQVIASVVIAVQSYFLGSRVLSSVKKRSRRRVSQREILEDVAPYRRR
jgi:cation transport ATPase